MALSVCPSGKEPHEAQFAQKLAKRSSKAWSQPCTAYKCHECGQWHIGMPKASKRHERPIPVINNNHQFRGFP